MRNLLGRGSDTCRRSGRWDRRHNGLILAGRRRVRVRRCSRMGMPSTTLARLRAKRALVMNVGPPLRRIAARDECVLAFEQKSAVPKDGPTGRSPAAAWVKSLNRQESFITSGDSAHATPSRSSRAPVLHKRSLGRRPHPLFESASSAAASLSGPNNRSRRSLRLWIPFSERARRRSPRLASKSAANSS